MADRSLGRLLGSAADDATILILSDHGFKNTDGWSSFRLRVDGLVEELGIEENLRAFKVSKRLYVRASSEAGGPALEQAREALLSAVHVPSGRPLLLVETEADGSFVVALSGGLRLAADDAVRLAGREVTLDRIAQEAQLGGTHSDHGIFVMACPTCRRDEDIGEVHVADVAPTLLHQMGLPVARDLDGRVVEAIYEENTPRPVRYVATYDIGIGGGQEIDQIDEEMESVLRSVGYVD
jgi:arylsulfatase A-like enzyme